MNAYHDELTTVTQRVFTFADESTDEIREQVNTKISLMSNKTDNEILDVKKFMTTKLDETKSQVHEKFKKHMVSNMDDMKLDLRRYVDDKQKVVLRVLRQETEDKILNEMKERLQVPGIVGNNCPYSTIGNFLMQFHFKVEHDFEKLRTENSALMTRVAQLESSQETTFREKEEQDKSLEFTIKEIQKDAVRTRGYHNQLKAKVEEVAKRSRPFT